MQPSCGVADQQVDAACPGGLQRIEHHGGRIGTGLLGDDRDLIAIPPDLELFHRRGPERVTGRQHDLQALVLVAPRQLADGGRLAGTVDSHHEDDERSRRVGDLERCLTGGEDLEHGAADGFYHGAGILQFVPPELLVQPLHDAGGSLHTHVAGQQPGLHLLQERLVGLAAGQQMGQVIGQPGLALVEPLAQSAEEALAIVGRGCAGR